MKPWHTKRQRPGHTLVELVTALASGTILLAGLGSVMMIASQIAYTPVSSEKRLRAAEAFNRLAEDARFATFFVTHTSNVLEFVVADRNSDGSAERIRYEWSGVAGAPLLRTLNGGTPVALVDSVQNFQCSLATKSQTTAVSTTTDTAEEVLASNTTSTSGLDRGISATSFSAQRINPGVFASIPAGATAWNATKVDFQGRRSGATNETLRVQIRSAGEPYDSPTSAVLGEVAILEANLSAGAGWNTAILSSPVRGLALHRMYDLVWRGATGDAGEAAKVYTDDGASTSVNESIDAGATWQYMPSRRTYYRIYGTYTSPGTTYNVTRNYATRVNVVLQAGNTTSSRINGSVPLDNQPELLSAYWRAEFDSNPTTTDITRDGVADWVMASAGTFNNSTLVNGVWQASGALESRPLNDFTKITSIDVRCRNTSVGGNGAVLQINADRQGGVHSPLLVRLQLQTDGSQILTLYGKSSDAANVSLFQRKCLSNGFIRYRLTILPANNVVNLTIDGEDQGTFAYPSYAPSIDDRFLTFYADTSNAEFDYAELRVVE